MYCSNCGAQVPDDAKFCASCGGSIAGGEATPEPEPTPVQATVVEPAQQFSLSGGMLAWSIVCTILGSLILGIIAIVFTVIAKDETTQEGYDKRMKVAKILNIISTILIVLGIIVGLLGGCALVLGSMGSY